MTKRMNWGNQRYAGKQLHSIKDDPWAKDADPGKRYLSPTVKERNLEREADRLLAKRS